MAYTSANLENVYSQVDGVWKMFRYLSTDSIGTITATSYVTDPLQHRMGLGDFVWVVNQTTPVTYLCQVSAYSATTNLATLAQVGTAESPSFTSVTVSGTLSVTGATTLTGNALASGTVSVTGATTLGSTLAVTGATTLTGAAVLGGATSTSVGFYGNAGGTQRSSSNQTSSNAAVSASFGASQLAILQEIMNTLTAANLWKGS